MVSNVLMGQCDLRPFSGCLSRNTSAGNNNHPISSSHDAQVSVHEAIPIKIVMIIGSHYITQIRHQKYSNLSNNSNFRE